MHSDPSPARIARSAAIRRSRYGQSLIVAACACCCLATACASGNDNDMISPPPEFPGLYYITGVSEGDPYCFVELGDQYTIGGWALTLEDTCIPMFGLDENIVSWSVTDDGQFLSFYNVFRQEVLRFERTGDGDYIVPVPGQNPRMAMSRVPEFQD